MKTCKFGVACLCFGCSENDGKRCKARKEPTCSVCSTKQFICVHSCTNKEMKGR